MRLALFRCDATPIIGGGHVGRCLAIADGLSRAGWHVVFSVGPDAERIFPRLKTSGYSVIRFGSDQLGNVDEFARCVPLNKRADLVVLDHYELDASFERACRRFADKILVLDDATGRVHDCNWLLDAAADCDDIYVNYIPAGAKILRGTRFALVRDEFIRARPQSLARRDGRPVRNILVSFGATDPRNASLLALRSLEGIVPHAAITVVLSSGAKHLDDVQRYCLHAGHRLMVDPADMASVLTEADLAVGGAGSSSYERAVLGLPSVTVVVAENQRGIATVMARTGASLLVDHRELDWPEQLARFVSLIARDANIRGAMTRAAAALVDGQASTRLAEIFQ